MSLVQFDRDQMASWYANRHLKTDRGILAVYYLPSGAPEREIRFLEVNELMAVRDNDPLEPIDFGVAIDGADAHTLLLLLRRRGAAPCHQLHYLQMVTKPSRVLCEHLFPCRHYLTLHGGHHWLCQCIRRVGVP